MDYLHCNCQNQEKIDQLLLHPFLVDGEVLQHYQVQHLIARGKGPNLIYKVRKRADGTEFALKALPIKGSATESKRAYRQKMLHGLLKSRYVLQLHESYLSSSQEAIYLLFDYFPFSLQNKSQVKLLSPLKKRRILIQIIRALVYLHGCKIVHRNLLPSKVLFNRAGKVKLTGFGSASFGPQVVHFIDMAVTIDLGDLRYKPPELLLGCKKFSTAFDIWAVGCLASYLFNGCSSLFRSASTTLLIKQVFQLIGYPSLQELNQTNTTLGELLCEVTLFPTKKAMLQRMLYGLPGDILQLVKQALVFSPAKRPTAAELLVKHFGLQLPAFEPVVIKNPVKQDHDRQLCLQYLLRKNTVVEKTAVPVDPEPRVFQCSEVKQPQCVKQVEPTSQNETSPKKVRTSLKKVSKLTKLKAEILKPKQQARKITIKRLEERRGKVKSLLRDPKRKVDNFEFKKLGKQQEGRRSKSISYSSFKDELKGLVRDSKFLII